MSHFRPKYFLIRCSSDEDLQVGLVSRERRRNSDNISPVTVCCWAMDRNIGKIGCFKIVKFWQLTKGFVWNQIFLQPSSLLSGFMERFKSFKNAETCVEIGSFMFSRQSAAQTSLVFLKCGCFIIIRQLNPFNPCPSPQGSPELVSPGVGPVSPQHQTVDTNREKDCTDLYNDQLGLK